MAGTFYLQIVLPFFPNTGSLLAHQSKVISGRGWLSKTAASGLQYYTHH